MNMAPPGRSGARDPGTVHIERLILRAVGLDESAAQSLARLVAQKLAPGLLRSSATAALDSLRVEVQATSADAGRPDLLAQRVADQLAHELGRDRATGAPPGVMA
jgi:hypothetical protein